MKRLSALIAAVAILLGGCGYYVEVNERSYVIAIGMDKGKNGLLKVSFLFAEPTSEGGGESEGGGGNENGGKEKDLVSFEAPTIYSALRLLDSFRSKLVDISHTKLIVFSQELAKEGINKYVTDFVDNRSFRPSVYLCVSQGKAVDFFDSIEPKQDVFIEKYIDRLFGKVTNDDVNEAYLYYNYFISSAGGSGNLLPLVSVAEPDNVKKAEENFESVIPDDFSANYTAKEIPIDKENAAVLCGYAVFDSKRMVGTLGLMESDIVRMVMKNLPRRDFSVYYPPKDVYVSVTLYQVDETQIKVKASDVPEIDMRVQVMGEFTGIEEGFSSKKDYDDFVKYLNGAFTDKLNKLLRRSQDEFSADIFNLGLSAQEHFLTNGRWRDYDWESRYPTAKINGVVDVEMNDYGELKYTSAGDGR